MLEFVEKITQDATRIGPAGLESLRSTGFSEGEILDVVLVASYANFITRVADALGVELDETYDPNDSMVAALSYPREA